MGGHRDGREKTWPMTLTHQALLRHEMGLPGTIVSTVPDTKTLWADTGDPRLLSAHQTSHQSTKETVLSMSPASQKP